ncbi:MAG: hypothetical protein GX846_01145, partial [Deltaproteobacteria bacterium]|nr:hypothetical protein [Deltaproteobacteria bacterium]
MMKRVVFFLMTVCLAAFLCTAGSSALAAEDGCSRDELNKITDMYFEAIQAHNTSGLPLAPSVKFTENGVITEVGKGFFKTAGKPLLKRTLVDTKKCVTATLAVVEEPFDSKTAGGSMMGGMSAPAKAPAKAPAGAPDAPGGGVDVSNFFAGPKEMPKEGTVRPILFANRLKVENGKITEIETIIAREMDFAFNAEGVLNTKDQDWD